ncbi:MAG: N-acetylornithine carbamoyltransferase [Flavobacteriales bacterium]|nr:N-acetylornithine carbamoyltransferase [Flavobacteriales bacterium]MCB9449487.1 N-acetylornithine carbamoyltransferase [Flavobacteriales bacterium]
MKQFLSANDVADIPALVKDALRIKASPHALSGLGTNKTLGLIFLNPSLRTRLSTQKAAMNLGMQVMVMNMGQDGWALETADGIVMNGQTAEHIREAAAVIGQYCDVIGVRSFGKLENREEDYEERFISRFTEFCGRPVISLESATLHPLQSLADLVTIEELKNKPRPKVVLTWAPHPKALLQAVPNSFAQWMNRADVDLVITHPEGYELAAEYVGNARVTYSQDEAFEGADFIYAKNWSSYTQYGKILSQDPSWTITPQKMALTHDAKFMHCLPVRRNMIVSEAVLDGPSSVVIRQAGNRVFAAQAVLKHMLEAIG